LDSLAPPAWLPASKPALVRAYHERMAKAPGTGAIDTLKDRRPAKIITLPKPKEIRRQSPV
jgi:hypothetical protein